MAERITRFDDLVKAEEKKVKTQENSFARANRTLKGASKSDNPSTEIKDEKNEIKEEAEVEVVERAAAEPLAYEAKTASPVNEANVITTDGKFDFSAVFAESKKPSSKTHSLYLDDDIYENLTKFANQKNVSISKVVNELLRIVFNNRV